MKRLLPLAAVALLTACSEPPPPPAPASTQAPPPPSAEQAFDEAVEALSAAYFRHVPEAATMLGLPEAAAPGASTRLMDRSPAGDEARIAALSQALERLQAIDPERLGGNRRVTHATLSTLIGGMLEPSRIADYGTTAGAWTMWYLPYPIVQNSGPTVDIPNLLASQQPVGDAADAERFLQRLGEVRGALDGALERLEAGVEAGAMPPDFILEKSLAVVEAFAAPPPRENALYVAFTDKLAAADVENAPAFADRALEIVEQEILPAYGRIAAYLRSKRDEAPHDAGLWRLPNGAELYAAMIRHMTDTPADPEEIHRTGLAEVERILAEMDAILVAQGDTDGTVGERMQRLNVDPRFLYPNDAEGKARLLDDIRGWVEGMYAELPRAFHRIPAHPLEVRPVPEFSQASAPMGYYNPPAPDGSRPGLYFINLRDTALHPRWTLPTLTYHEAVPGHHLDGATSVDRDVPAVVKALWSNTSGEGWALYAEQLAAELGMYDDDPYADLGRLQAELHRAVRLVVDTGMHAMRWSREEAIAYMVDTEGLDEATATSEIERFVVWPAQALGYKLGQLNILALREEARAALGEAFDLRDFNQQVLDVASAPMPFIQATVRAWIAETREATGSAAPAPAAAP